MHETSLRHNNWLTLGYISMNAFSNPWTPYNSLGSMSHILSNRESWGCPCINIWSSIEARSTMSILRTFCRKYSSFLCWLHLYTSHFKPKSNLKLKMRNNIVYITDRGLLATHHLNISCLHHFSNIQMFYKRKEDPDFSSGGDVVCTVLQKRKDHVMKSIISHLLILPLLSSVLSSKISVLI